MLDIEHYLKCIWNQLLVSYRLYLKMCKELDEFVFPLVSMEQRKMV